MNSDFIHITIKKATTEPDNIDSDPEKYQIGSLKILKLIFIRNYIKK